MEMRANLVKYGNSHYFRVRAEYIKAGLLQEGGSYKLDVKTEKETLEELNKELAKKLEAANKILKEKGLQEIPLEGDLNKRINIAEDSINQLVGKDITEKNEEARNGSEGLTRTTDLLQLADIINMIALNIYSAENRKIIVT